MSLRWWMQVVSLAVAVAPAGAKVLVEENFDQGRGTWGQMLPAGELKVQAAVAHAGSAAQIDYDLTGDPPVMVIGTGLAVDLTEAREFRFQLRTSETSVFYFAATEADGSAYGTIFRTRAKTWEAVSISPDRLRLEKEKTDENGRLDLDQVQSVGIADASAMFAGGKPLPGQRQTWLDDFAITTDESPTGYSLDGQLPYLLDGFERGVPLWLSSVGEVTLDETIGALEWSYPAQAKSTFCMLLSPPGPLPATGARSLLLSLRCERAMTLAVVLQEQARDGRNESRYVAILNLEPSELFDTHAVALAEMTLDTTNGGSDENGQLDLDQVETIILGDAGMFGGGGPANRVWLDELELVKD